MLTLPLLLACAGSLPGGVPSSDAPGSSPSVALAPIDPAAVAPAPRAPQYVWSAAEGGRVELAPEGALFDWNAHVDAEGVRFESGVAWTKTPGERAWVRVRTTSFGRIDDARPVGSGSVERDGARASIVRPGLVEWFEGRSDGLEQGWTIVAPPAGERSSAVWIGLAFEGLAPQIAEDGKSAKLVDARAIERFAYRNLVARDASGKELDARLAISPLGVGVRVDDANARYPIEIDPVISGVAWVFEPNQAGADCGFANTAGDVNGDGYSDFVVSAWAFDGPGGVDTGAAWCFHGGPGGLSAPASPSWTSYGSNQPGAAFGHWCSGLGDVDGDGFDDVAICAAYFSNPEAQEGAVYVYLGSAAGLTTTPIWTIEGNQALAHFGKVFHAGDLNGDGRADLAVCTQSDGTPGFARVYAGSSNPTPGAPLWTMNAAGLAAYGVTPSSFDDQTLTPTISGAGDVNADGFDDLLLSCTNTTPGLIGRAFVFLGSATGPSSTPVWAVNGPGAFQSFGFMSRPAGDVNGDGYADVVITDYRYPTGLAGAPGAAMLYLANPTANPTTILPTSPSQIITASQPTAELGWNAGAYCAGDIDGDGFADLFLGGAYDNFQTGHVELFRGSSNTPPFAATADITILGGQLGGLLGWSTGTAGDVNGDGRSDVYATQLRVDNPEVDEGAVYVYHGQASDTPAFVPVSGETANVSGFATSRQGTAVSNVGDVNSDGFSDLVTGAPEFDVSVPLSNVGRVELRRGSASGVDSSPWWSYTGTQANARASFSVAWAGDVDNDGFDDLVVGAPRFDNPQVDEGQLYLFRGNASGLLASTPDQTLESNEGSARFGESVAGAGDVNGDGFADVIVGAPGTHFTESDRGAVYVYLGSATGLIATPYRVYDGETGLNSRFGAAVATAGDLNRDGYSDIVVGAPRYANTQTDEGRVYVYLGAASGLPLSTPSWTQDSGSLGALYGSSVSSAGDLDADGFADLVIGAPGFQAASTGGRAWVYRGQAGLPPLVTPAVATLSIGLAFAEFGARVASAGDVNDDGFSDLLIGAPGADAGQGRMLLFLGNSAGVATSAAQTFNGSGAGARLGEGIGPIGDVDGDGFSDPAGGQPGNGSGSGGCLIYMGGSGYGGTFGYQQRQHAALDATRLLNIVDDSTSGMGLVTGSGNHEDEPSTPMGRARVRLEYEVDLFNQLLDGTGLGRGPWVDTGLPVAGGSVSLTATVNGLAPSSGYHWRARVATDNPLYPHGRWLSLQGNGRQEKKIGTGFDCNNNQIPDATEVQQNPALDCNGNGVPDSCDISSGFDLDCDNDTVPNSCELFANDCDADSYPDDCQLAAGEPDCNTNNLLDECELTPVTDANGDLVLDVCQFTPYCFGDGTGTPCPCGNNGSAGRGCANSVNANGAVITVTGEPSLTSDTLVLHGAGMPNSASPSAVYLQGTDQDNLGLGTPLLDGLRCVTGSLIRLGTRPNSGNQSQYPDVGNQPISVRGLLVSLTAPQTRHYQVYYRNAAATFCPPGTANWSNGFTVTWHM